VLVGWWLGLVRLLATPLVRARVPPNVVTGLAVAAAAGAAVVAPALPVVAAGLVLVNGVLDGLDGAVAVLSRRETRLGFLLDSLADRVSDVLLLVALWRAGAPGLACVAAGVALGLLEYARARAGQAGMREIGVVTVGERPVRVVLGAAGLAVPASVVPGVAAGVTAALAGIGLVQFLVVAVRRLTSPPD
jgi:CDP-diacylglycerol--glycerol-3-phosphate 3-phosphatidyltransferase